MQEVKSCGQCWKDVLSYFDSGRPGTILTNRRRPWKWRPGEAWEDSPLCSSCPQWPMETMSHLAGKAVWRGSKAQQSREKPNYLGLLAVPVVCQKEWTPSGCQSGQAPSDAAVSQQSPVSKASRDGYRVGGSLWARRLLCDRSKNLWLPVSRRWKECVLSPILWYSIAS